VKSSWWTNSQRNINSTDAGGGATHAIQGTLLLAGVTAVIAVPTGVLTAIYLVEYGRGPVARAVSFMVDILTGVPSIVAALFVYAVWVTTFGFQRVGFAVCLALVLLMLPVVVRSTEEMLKLVPNELREASYALGVAKWVTIVRIVLPTAFSGIVTGVLLGLARIIGETAPLLILGPYTKSIATNLFSGPMPTLPTMINQDRTELGIATAVERMWATPSRSSSSSCCSTSSAAWWRASARSAADPHTDQPEEPTWPSASTSRTSTSTTATSRRSRACPSPSSPGR
jgi:phosphate transport system permease protein